MSHRTASRQTRAQVATEVNATLPRQMQVPHATSSMPRRAKNDDSEDEYATADEGNPVYRPTSVPQARKREHVSQRLERAHTLPPRRPPPMAPLPTPPMSAGHNQEDAPRRLAPAPLTRQALLSKPVGRTTPDGVRRAPFLERAAPSRMYARKRQEEPETLFPGKTIPVANIPFPTVRQSRSREREINRRRLNVNKPLPRSPSPGERRRSNSLDTTASYNSMETEAPGISRETRKRFDHLYSNTIQDARESMDTVHLGRKAQYTNTDPNFPFYETRRAIRMSETYQKVENATETMKKGVEKVTKRVRRDSQTISNAVQDATWEAKRAAKTASNGIKEATHVVGQLARRASQEFTTHVAKGIRKVTSRSSLLGSNEDQTASRHASRGTRSSDSHR